MTKHPLSWFEARKKTTIRKIRIDADRGEITSYVPLDDYWVQRCYEQQEQGDVYFIENFTASRDKKNDPIDDMGEIKRIHVDRSTLCEGCSG